MEARGAGWRPSGNALRLGERVCPFPNLRALVLHLLKCMDRAHCLKGAGEDGLLRGLICCEALDYSFYYCPSCWIFASRHSSVLFQLNTVSRCPSASAESSLKVTALSGKLCSVLTQARQPEPQTLGFHPLQKRDPAWQQC